MKINRNFFKKIPYKERRMTCASLVTLCRIMLTPFVAIAIIKGQRHYAALLFLIAAMTDMLDGAIARFFDQKTFLGEWLDACADKLLLVVTSGSLLFSSWIHYPVAIWFLIIGFARELLLVVGSWWFFCTYGYFSAEPMSLAKVSMALYVASLLWLLTDQLHFSEYGYLLMGVTLFCSLVSLWQRFFMGEMRLMFRKRIKEW